MLVDINPGSILWPSSMRVLFLTQVLPYPLDAGPKIRAYYVLRHLGDQLIKQKTSEILK